MHRILRNTHLILGMAAVFFVLTYAVSAVQMAHQFRLTPAIRETDLSLAPGMEARALAAHLMDDRGFTGELGNIQDNPAGFRFAITHPGANYNVTYDRATGRTHVREADAGFMGVLNRLHHLNGFGHASAAMNAWAWSLALVSATFLLLGATGIYLWYRRRQERIAGTILLAVNLTVSLGLLAWLRAGV